MIREIEIENFKSIQKLSISPARVNLFIGKPASGKSNIIEAISLLSKRTVPIKDLVRMKEYNDLLYDRDIERKLRTKTDQSSFMMQYQNGSYHTEYYDILAVKKYSSIRQQIERAKLGVIGSDLEKLEREYKEQFGDIRNYLDEHGLFKFSADTEDNPSFVKTYLKQDIFYYKFKVLAGFENKSTERLNAPFGNNLPQIILTRGSLKKMITEILSDYDLKLGLNPNDNTVKIIKEQDGIIYDYPFVSLSDSLQRLIFYITAMHTENSTLLFEEPESHIFPFYNKYLGEKIALDESNQYCIATHSAPFLFSVLQKTKPEDLRVYITYFEDGQTKVYSVPQEKFSDLYEMQDSFFLNLQHFKDGI